ncbi:MAG: YfhO family protein [Spirochaetia bacterium]|nr:YfhO family protein [Spirochaetia bacterium]
MEPVQKKSALRELAPYLLITAAVLIFFSPVLFTTSNYFIGDIYTQFFPWKDFLKNSIQGGCVPFWNPLVFSGVPFAADIQKGTFYPPGVVFMVLDFSAAMKIYVLFHFLLMGYACFALLKKLNFSASASFIGVLVYLFNSFTLSRINSLSALGSYSYIPLLSLTLLNYTKNGFFSYWPLFTLLCSLSLLAGHPPTVMYTAIFLIAFRVYLAGPARQQPREFMSAFLFGVITILASALLSMPQSGLFWEYLNLSTRGTPFDYAMAADTSMSFKNLWSFMMPGGLDGFNVNYLNNWSLYAVGIRTHLSITALFLIFLSFFYPKNRLYIFSLSMVLFAILLGLGKNTPVHSWFFVFLPFFSLLRHPGFAMTLLVLPAAFMCAFTVDNIRSLTHAHVPIIHRFAYTKAFSRRIFRFIFYTLLSMTALLLLIVINRATVIKNYGMTDRQLLYFIFGLAGFLGIFGFNFLAFYLREKALITGKFHTGLVAFLIFFELMYFISPINPTVDSVIYKPRDLKLATVPLFRTTNYKLLHTEAAAACRVTSGRTLLDAQAGFISMIPSNTAQVFGFSDAGGYNPVEPKIYTDYIRHTVSGDTVLDTNRINILNVKYIISMGDLANPEFEKIYDGPFRIYRNPRAYPVFFTSASADRPDLIVGQYSWSRQKEYDYTMYKVDASVEKDGYFVFSNNYYPGWNVYVDNQMEKPVNCFGIYMGVKIPKGSHVVTFKYSPTNIRLYSILFLTIAGLMLFLGLIYTPVFKKRQMLPPPV